jgi:flagellar protein FliT
MVPPDDGAFGAHPVLRLIDRYESIAQASRAMLAAAQRDDWDEIGRLEARCRALIADLHQAARVEQLALPEQRRRVALLRSILADDAQIRARSEPWLQQLERLLAPPAGGAG